MVQTVQSAEERSALMETALGHRPADTVFQDARLLNVYSGEIMSDWWLAVKGERFAYAGPPLEGLVGDETRVVKLEGGFILPGFIDAHTHLDDKCRVEAFTEYALAFGNTTAVSETAMITNAMGATGARSFLEQTSRVPMRIFVLAPPLVPPWPGLETSRPFPFSEFMEILSSDRCLGVGETYWNRLLAMDRRAVEAYSAAEAMGKTKEGHSAGAKGARLAAFAAGGTTSCHESISLEEALERLRLGLAVQIREGYVRRELNELSGLARSGVDLSGVMLVTDSSDPGELVEKGGMNLLLARAVELGFDPIRAVQMVTINPARYFGLRDLGGLGPGKLADLVVVDDLQDFRCRQVWVGGRQVAQDGRVIVEIPPYRFPEEVYRSITIQPLRASDFRFKHNGAGEVQVRAVDVTGEIITRELISTLSPVDGRLEADPSSDLLKAAVVNKDRPEQAPSLGFVKGFGLKRGAAASSMLWDANNLLIVGTDDEEMAAAVNRLIEIGGGMVAVSGGAPVAEVPFPICGIISSQPLPEVMEEMRNLEKALWEMGCSLTRPILVLQTFCFTGLPFIRLTDRALVDIKRGDKVPVLV